MDAVVYVGKVYRYTGQKKIGNRYKVVGTTLMKHPTKREWMPSVLYYPIDKPDDKAHPETYVRETKDFLEHFSLERL